MGTPDSTKSRKVMMKSEWTKIRTNHRAIETRKSIGRVVVSKKSDPHAATPKSSISGLETHACRRNPGTRKCYPISGRLVGLLRDRRAEMPGVMGAGVGDKCGRAYLSICSCHTNLGLGCMCMLRCSGVAIAVSSTNPAHARCQDQGLASGL